ncbi:hypothetical protein [Metabacillus sp. 84]|uniref:hypothetical protein n=1 Tax=Metabacillus sp. 84 TaxID=3404705 RepID=UPI003CF10EDA
MGYKIEANPDKLEAFANSIVKELAFLEKQADTLDDELDNIIKYCSPEYLHCFSGVGNTAATSDQVIERLDKHERDIRDAGGKLVEQDDILMKLYDFYDQYNTAMIFGGSMLGAGKYMASGVTQFLLNADGNFIVKNMQFLDDFGRMVDQSKYKTIIKAFISPTMMGFKNKSVSELLFKRMTGFFADDAANFNNNVRNWVNGSVDDLGKKVSFMDVVKTGGKFAKGNFLLTTVVTAGSETFGAGVTIADNYNKYGDNPEVLKRENAKAVGKAANKTFWVTAGSGVGTVIGGALGSFGTPVGTVLGGAAGGAAGAYVGERIAEATAGAAESLALKYDDTIQSGITGIRNLGGDVSKGIEKASAVASKVTEEVDKHLNKGIDMVEKGINDAGKKVKNELKKVEDTAASMVNGAKDFLSNPFSFG